MTVTDRRPATRTTQASPAAATRRPDDPGPAAVFAPTLADALADARLVDPRPRLVSTTIPVDPIDPIDLFAAARAIGLEAVLLLRPADRHSIVGIGRAWACEPAGPDRFTTAATAWRDLLADAIRSSEHDSPSGSGTGGGGPLLLGGLGFSGRAPGADEPWSPFGSASLVLPTYTATRIGDWSGLTVAVGPDESATADAGALEAMWQDLCRAAESGAAETGPPGLVSAPGQDDRAGTTLDVTAERPDRAGWDRTVGLFAGAVGRGRIDKAVLARRVDYRASADLDVVAALRHLAATAPESTTYAFVRGETTFLGATPERLVRTTGRTFEAAAIAGSAARGADPAADASLAATLLASEKEREEHAVVVDMLRTSLAPIAEELHVAATPSILPLRHLQHLATPVTGRLRADAGLLALGDRLHPTPAVGGAPRADALALIDEHEGFDRGWYAGPIGWLGADGDGELLVALRCGLVRGRDATFFAGCGIVADSDPAREWEESNLKLRTMLAALRATDAETPR